MVSFYNYEPREIEKINSWKNLRANFHQDKIETSQAVDFGGKMLENSKSKMSVGKPAKGRETVSFISYEFDNAETNKVRLNSPQKSKSCGNIKQMTRFVNDQNENIGHGSGVTTRFDLSEATYVLKEKKKESKRNNAYHARKINKNPKEKKLTTKRNSTLVTEDKQEKIISSKETTGQYDDENRKGKLPDEPIQAYVISPVQNTSDTNYECSATVERNSINPNRLQTTSAGAYVNDTECEMLDINSVPKFDSNFVLDFETKTREKRISKPGSHFSDCTAIAWQDSPRKSLDMGIALVHNTGLLVVQTSSVCVMISEPVDRQRSPVNSLRLMCAKIIANPMFDWFIIAVIFLNTVDMATEHHGMDKKLQTTLDHITLVSTPFSSLVVTSILRYGGEKITLYDAVFRQVELETPCRKPNKHRHAILLIQMACRHLEIKQNALP